MAANNKTAAMGRPMASNFRTEGEGPGLLTGLFNFWLFCSTLRARLLVVLLSTIDIYEISVYKKTNYSFR